MLLERPSRDEAWSLFREFNESDALIKHALAVEAVMRRFAKMHGEDEEKWGVVGLLHDLDYERFPLEHCAKCSEILRSRGWPEDYVRAVASHGWCLRDYVHDEPLSRLEKTLYAVDELSGLVAATALVRPSKSVMDLEASSVLKKFKQKSFAASVDRDLIRKGAERLGVDLQSLTVDVIDGMRGVAASLGL